MGLIEPIGLIVSLIELKGLFELGLIELISLTDLAGL